MFPEGFKQCLLTEPISPLVPTKHIITQVSRLACRKQGLKGKGSGTRRAFLVALSGEDSGSASGKKRRVSWFGDLGTGNPDFTGRSVPKQGCDLAP